MKVEESTIGKLAAEEATTLKTLAIGKVARTSRGWA